MQRNNKLKYSVANTIRYRLDQENHEANCTYEIQFEKIENKNFRIELKRNNYKISNKEITSKFAKLAYDYTTALFPTQFDIKEDSLYLCNFNEIVDRINIKDAELNLKYQGEGLHYIRDSFLAITTKNIDTMVQYFSKLGLIRVILFCIQNLENNEQHDDKWMINILNLETSWTGKKTYDLDTSTLKYHGQLTNTEELFDSLEEYANLYELPLDAINRELPITSYLNHEIQFVTQKLDFEYAESEIKINHDFFDYQETFSLAAIKNNPD